MISSFCPSPSENILHEKIPDHKKINLNLLGQQSKLNENILLIETSRMAGVYDLNLAMCGLYFSLLILFIHFVEEHDISIPLRN